MPYLLILAALSDLYDFGSKVIGLSLLVNFNDLRRFYAVDLNIFCYLLGIFLKTRALAFRIYVLVNVLFSVLLRHEFSFVYRFDVEALLLKALAFHL